MRFIRLLVGIIFALPGVSLWAGVPVGWVAQDIGGPTLASQATYDETTGRVTLLAGGTGPGGVADQCFFMHRELIGDGEVVARVGGQANTNGGAKAGVMLRASLAPGSSQVGVYLTPNTGVAFQFRATEGAAVVSDGAGNNAGVVWVKISRVANRFSAYKSADGHHWEQVGATQTLVFPAALRAGLAQASVNGGVRGTAWYERFAVAPTADGTTTATAVNIGRAGALGSATVNGAGTAYTLQTNGAAINGAQDDFTFLHAPLAADGELVARLTELDAARGWATAGLMVRVGTGRGAVHLAILQTPMNGLTLRYRAVADTSLTERARIATTRVTRWLKITRRSSFYAAFHSDDGVVWRALGEPVVILGAGPIQAGLVAANDQATSFLGAHFDQVAWPAPVVAPPAETDAAVIAGLAAWRKPDTNGISCVDCHTPFGYDIAQFNFTRADVRLATTPHLPQSDADLIFEMLEVYRDRHPPVGGLKDFRTFRPLQPGGGQVVGGETASPNARDFAFGQYLQTHFRIGQGRISTLAQARAAGQELVDVDVASVPVGLKFNLWSRSVLREGAVTGGEVAEWLPSTGLVPKPGLAAAWFALHDAYIRDPSTNNMWAIYEASGRWVQLDAHNFEPGVVHGNWRWVIEGQYRANLLFAHDELLKARGLPSLLDAEDGVRPFRDVRPFMTVDLAPFWGVGDNARVVQGGGFGAMPRRNRESVHNNTSRNNNLGEVNGWQIQDFRLTWFWIGWVMDNSLRFSGEGSTLSGEYFIGSLWSGEVDDPVWGDSASSHGFRFHQVFFNAVQQFKLAYKPGAWRDGSSTPQHFQANKGYYLGYDRWRPRSEPNEPGLAQSGPLYRRILSNHIRMGLLVHADEARSRGGVYFGENFTLYDIALWRQLLAWADPEWAQADEALFAELRASLTTTLSPADMADDDADGRPNLLAAALGLPTSVGGAMGGGAGFPERYGATAEGRLTLSFLRAQADYTYVVEASVDLATWTVLATNPGVVGQEVTVADLAEGAGAPRRFLRLRVVKALP